MTETEVIAGLQWLVQTGTLHELAREAGKAYADRMHELMKVEITVTPPDCPPVCEHGNVICDRESCPRSI